MVPIYIMFNGKVPDHIVWLVMIVESKKMVLSLNNHLNKLRLSKDHYNTNDDQIEHRHGDKRGYYGNTYRT